MNTPPHTTSRTVTLGEVELIFFCAAAVVLCSALLEHLISAPSQTNNYLQLPTVLLTLGYWTLSIRGISLLIRGMGSQRADGTKQGESRRDLLAGGLIKISSLILLGDFMLNITREKAICFFITMVGYGWLGLIGLLLMHFYLSRSTCKTKGS